MDGMVEVGFQVMDGMAAGEDIMTMDGMEVGDIMDMEDLAAGEVLQLMIDMEACDEPQFTTEN